MTLAEVEIANYPFATIKPNSGVGYVRVRDPAQDFNNHSSWIILILLKLLNWIID
jgi:ribosome-binding ATPase YchF (GTP1/OBG family)